MWDVLQVTLAMLAASRPCGAQRMFAAVPCFSCPARVALCLPALTVRDCVAKRPLVAHNKLFVLALRRDVFMDQMVPIGTMVPWMIIDGTLCPAHRPGACSPA